MNVEIPCACTLFLPQCPQIAEPEFLPFCSSLSQSRDCLKDLVFHDWTQLYWGFDVGLVGLSAGLCG